jgi:predicted transcriptional regulator
VYLRESPSRVAVLLGCDTALADALIEGRAADAKDAGDFGYFKTELR